MKKIALFTMIIFSVFHACVYGASTGSLQITHGTNQDIDMEMINSQIESLTNLKDYYLAKAARIRNLGDRVQFSSEQDGLITAQKCWKSADRYDRIADQIQGEINNLEKERDQVLQKASY